MRVRKAHFFSHARNERGDVRDLITTMLMVLICFVCIRLTLSVWSCIMTKWRLDSAVDQLARQIELVGYVDTDEDGAIAQQGKKILSSLKCDGVEVTVTFSDGKNSLSDGGLIQLGEPFQIDAVADSHIGGFFGGSFIIHSSGIQFHSTAAGVSEKHWKNYVSLGDSTVTWASTATTPAT